MIHLSYLASRSAYLWKSSRFSIASTRMQSVKFSTRSHALQNQYQPNPFWSNPNLGAPLPKDLSKKPLTGPGGKLPDANIWVEHVEKTNSRVRMIFIPLLGLFMMVYMYTMYQNWGEEPKDWVTEVPEVFKKRIEEWRLELEKQEELRVKMENKSNPLPPPSNSAIATNSTEIKKGK